MKKTAIAVLLGAMLMALAAGAAVAGDDPQDTTINCMGGTCNGTNRADEMFETFGFTDAEDDLVLARRGNDNIEMNRTGDQDADIVYAKEGDDTINVRDLDTFDTVYCGRGIDTATINEGEITRNCETVIDSDTNGT